MKKIYLICLTFMALNVNAQQIIVPSSFNENKMIVKKMDADGNFVPVEENTLTENTSEKAPVPATTKKMVFKKDLPPKEQPTKEQPIKKTVDKVRSVPKDQLKKSNDQLKEKTEPPKRKYKRIEKDYSIQKSTFRNNADDSNLPTEFQNETMERAQDALQKERYSFEECAPDDKDCQEYDIDSKGNMILK